MAHGLKHPLSFLLAAAALLLATPAFAVWQTPGQATAELAQATPQAPGLTTTVREPFYRISAEDVGKAVAEQLRLQAVAPLAQATLTAGSPQVLYTADHPLQVVIHALQIDPTTKRWQAQAYVMAAGKTETVQPVSGTYDALVNVPVLTRQLGQTDVIAASDLTFKPMPERQLRKDTITNTEMLIGKSPRALISAQRPIREAEIAMPLVIKKGDTVELSYSTKYMSIKTTGIALENGSVGESIRIKNEKSEKAVSGRVVAAGRVEVNPSL